MLIASAVLGIPWDAFFFPTQQIMKGKDKKMKTEICKEQYVASMTAMPASSEEQNRSLKQKLSRQELSLQQCYVMIRREQVVARAVIYDELSYIGNLTLEDVEQSEADQFVGDVVKRLDRSREWRIDLYSDKINYTLLYRALKRWFPIEIKRESYTAMSAEQNVYPYEFVPAKQLTKENLLELMVSASRTTLDLYLQKEHTCLGLYPAVQKQMEELLDDEESDTLFQVLFINRRPAGFISVNRLLDDIGGIGYIGVHSDYQGRRLGSVLLQKALDMAWRNDIHKLIGEIDDHNIAIRKNLIQCGFTLDCKMCMFLLEKQ